MLILSIIVPIYNVEQYIEECLSSLIEKTAFGQYDVILVDDCGNDDSISKVNAYIDMYPNIFKMIHHDKNRGLSAARNTGIEYSKARYVTFVDSDDWLKEGSIGLCLKTLNKEPVDLLFFDHNKFWPGRVEPKVFNSGNNAAQKLSDSNEITKLITQVNVHACTKVFRRELFDNHLFPENLVFEDVAFIPSVINKCSTAYYLPHVLYQYRQRENSLSSEAITDTAKLYVAHEELYCHYTKSKNSAYIFISIRDLLIYLPRALISKNNNEKALEYMEKSTLWLDKHYPDWKSNKFFSRSTDWKRRVLKWLFYGLKYRSGRVIFLYLTNYDRIKEKLKN